MLTPQNQNGTVLAVVLLMLILVIPLSSFSRDFTTPHAFAPGDVVSADMMNEVFEFIRKSKKEVVPSDIIGTWKCTSAARGVLISMGEIALNWASNVDDLYIYLEGADVTFTDDQDGTYSFSTSTPNPFNAKDTNSQAWDGPFDVFQGVLWILYAAKNTRLRLSVHSISETKIAFHNIDRTGAYDCVTLICDKQNLPPNHPTRLEAVTLGLAITLGWIDNSEDEEGFTILRRDSLEGTYTEIGTTSANATTYSDTVPAEGKYWYRVKATNAYGDSLGSNVAKVRVSQ